ncbi:hypothetical protein QBC33DRAFT_623415 [Phialemonium atrogriseum]|uniref:Aminoglycoside phosphotransferase domain-containing protein n=1 Tax=Phialemonium atrogriseum TaxID=1093897 RepID=A0AAJ0FD57_9PEZI|nr:uncharacterized protein QBC33DRAFT_623415 [Phialemonium atrogriseum]KAK1762852.1 hypothetical protein QBC33DRAFT_623415 [Phialemonium atrogriseum]
MFNSWLWTGQRRSSFALMTALARTITQLHAMVRFRLMYLRSQNRHHVTWWTNKRAESFGQAEISVHLRLNINSIRAVLRPLLPLLDFGAIDDTDIPITIEPLAEGTWNQTFTISKESGDRHFVFQVPHVYAYDSSSDNALGYEWILMDKIAGSSSFYDLQSDMSTEEKLDVARTVADWVHQLHSLQFETCCEAEVRDPRQHLRARYDSLLGQVKMVGDYRAGAKFAVYSVDKEFSDIPEQERDARLDKIKSTAEAELATLEDINAVKQGNDFIDWDTTRYTITQGLAIEVDRFSEMLEQCSDCSEILDILYSPSILATHAETSVSSTILFHWDISSHNILVDNNMHRVTALLDWEQIHTLPRFVIPGAYPPVLQPDWGMQPDSRSHLSEWDGEEGDDKPQARLHREMCWDKQLMRGAFRERLKQLDSPWLCVIKTFSEREERERMKEETGWDADSTDSDDVDAGQETPPMMWSDLVAEAFRIIQGLDGVGIDEARDLLEECKKFAGLDSDASS